MLLRTSISNYKKLFQKTLNNFKSLFSPSYQKIPKTPPHNNERSKNNAVLSSSSTKQEEEVHLHVNNKKLVGLKNEKKEKMEKRGNKQEFSSLSMLHSKSMVEKKLKELEMLEMSNVDYILDIEEVLHYYSRLTCPSYLEIVDKFFVEMFNEFFAR